jgi:hypothetical protein
MRFTLPVVLVATGAVALTGGIAVASTHRSQAIARPIAFSNGPATAPAASHPAAAISHPAAVPARDVAAPARPTAPDRQPVRRAAPINDCDAFGMEITAVDTEPGMGHLETELRVHNINVGDSCRLPGGLRVSIVDRKTGRPVASARTAGRATTVVLGPNASAAMLLRTQASVANLPAGQKCSSPGYLAITLPGRAAHRVTAEAGDRNYVSCGGLTLSALRPRT